jgi:phosphatidylinositol alpha-1,6-mannosyltransferase
MAGNLILGIFPELAGLGGIQQVSRHIGATLEELAAKKHLSCELIGLNDPSGEDAFEVAGREYSFRGFERNKAGLLAHLTVRARATQLVFTGHVNLAPLALGMKVLHHGLRYWVTVHGIEVWEPLPLARRHALGRASGIIAVSRYTAEVTAKMQEVAPGKISVLSPALDPRHSAPDSEPLRWPVPPGSRVLLTVGRLLASEPGKGVDLVIQALPRLLKSFPNLYYVVIGDGDGRPPLEKLAAECGVAERVLFPGSRSGSLRTCYEAAEVFVMPSRQEGFGIVYLEAMAAGRPVVGAACGGATEVIADGETGFLVNYGDVPALEQRLAALLANDGLRQKMGEAGRRRTEELYRFEQFRDRLIGILESHGD